MLEFDARLSINDIDVIVSSLDSPIHELQNNLNFFESIKEAVPFPHEDSENYEPIIHIKNQITAHSKYLQKSLAVRQRETTFIKTKLLLLKDKINEDPNYCLSNETIPQSVCLDTKAETNTCTDSQENGYQEDVIGVSNYLDKSFATKKDKDIAVRLSHAEEYMKEVGIKLNYLEYLKQHGLILSDEEFPFKINDE